MAVHFLSEKFREIQKVKKVYVFSHNLRMGWIIGLLKVFNIDSCNKQVMSSNSVRMKWEHMENSFLPVFLIAQSNGENALTAVNEV